MRKGLKRFFYLGYDKETIRSLDAEINNYNIQALIAADFTLVAVMALCTIYVTVFLIDFVKTAMCIAMGLMAVASIVFLRRTTAWGQRELRRMTELTVNILMAICFFCGAYMGSFGSQGNLAVSFVLILAIFPVFFIRLPHKNIIIIAIFVVMFWGFSYITKTKSAFIYDVLHSSMGGISGVAISWSLSRTKVENMISKIRLEESNSALYNSSITDSLTGLPNRFHIMEQLNEMTGCKEALYLVCLVFDIDDFKAYNDNYGHPQGDALLKQIGGIMKDYALEEGISVGRIGGEEFMAIWKTDAPEKVDAIASGLRRKIEDMRVPHRGARASEFVTISIGVFAAPVQNQIAHNAYQLADQALYLAKDNGRNCCWRYDWESEDFHTIQAE